ncbi:MAG: M23 family metallopeptidase, partial [Bilophila sp.]
MSGFRRTISYGFVFVFLAFVAYGTYIFLDDLDGPQIVMTPDTGRVSPTQDIQLTLTDAKSKVRSVTVYVRKNSQSLVVFERTFSTTAASQTASFNLKNAGLRDGSFELEVVARDTALAGFGKGNSSTRVWDMRIDTQPPRVKVRTLAPALRRGSVTAIAYTVSEEVGITGIVLGSRFFTAHKQPNGLYYCFFAWPLDVSKDAFTPEVMAKDLAGNEARSRVLVNAAERNYRNDTLNISDKFLNDKMPNFEALVPNATTNLERYILVNTEVRIANEKRLIEVGKDTAPTMLWSGAFQRLHGSAVKANYGDHRTYMHNGVKIDEQTHMGLDLASTMQAPVPAANDGRVVLAENLGIFGNIVVIDHGLGLQSLYSHLSEIHVNVGDAIKKGATLGRTGVTGLAGGDHLHFGVLLDGVQVHPIDWLDPK